MQIAASCNFNVCLKLPLYLLPESTFLFANRQGSDFSCSTKAVNTSTKSSRRSKDQGGSVPETLLLLINNHFFETVYMSESFSEL